MAALFTKPSVMLVLEVGVKVTDVGALAAAPTISPVVYVPAGLFPAVAVVAYTEA